MTRAKTLWGFIENRDHRVMRRMNRWKAPRWIRFWMLAATRMGDGWIWYSLAGILLLGGGANRYAAVGAAGSAAIVGVFLFKALKRISHRQRPCQFEPHCWARYSPGPVFLSFGSHHDGIRHLARGQLFLSFPGSAAVFSCHQHRRFSHRSGHALP